VKGYRVHLGGKRYARFVTIEAATKFRNDVAARTNVFLSIEARDCATCFHASGYHDKHGCFHKRLLGRKYGNRLEECTCKKFVPKF